ncbi:MAG TPA: hypothetical protein VHE33_05925 [Acidobacteriaceae bacterium]|nr:hypothetical protein [Acidobacteriaceae bacterium]
MDKLSAKIENWAVVDNLIFHGFRKLEPGQRLTGYLMGHSDLPNGVIYTSVIQRVDQANGLVETGNTVYRLGQVNEFYQQWATNEAEEATQQVHFMPDSRRPSAGYPAVGSIPAYRQG